MCGRCTKSASGISSQLETVSASNTKISLDRADASSLPLSVISGLLEHVVLHTAAGLQHHTVTPQMFQTGRRRDETKLFFYLKKRNVSSSCQVCPCHRWYSASLRGDDP